jgi:hypothetical protein
VPVTPPLFDQADPSVPEFGSDVDVKELSRNARRQKVRVVRGVRSRRLIRRVDTWTVFKVSLLFYTLLLGMVLLALVVLWNVATAFGTVNTIEKSVKTLFDYKTFTLHPAAVFGWTAAGGGVLVVIGTLLNVVAALMYNLISDVIGGVQVVVVSEPELPQDRPPSA